MVNWISLTPSGENLVNSVKNGLNTIQSNLQSHQDSANWYNEHGFAPNEDGVTTASAKEFKNWYDEKIAALREESNYNGPLPSEVIEEAASDASELLDKLFPSSGSSYAGSGTSYKGASADAKLQAQTMQDYINMIQKTTDANNAWAADQAQKQMDFQERMARNAHRYEIEDLKAAGLNPVLSVSGGNGAAAASGAMAQPDTTNSNLVAQLAMQAVDSLGSSAIQVANGYSSKASNSFKNSLLGIASKYFVPALARGAAAAITRGLF